MAVIIGSARISETDSINGVKGDQTGREVSTQNWYLHSKGWVLIRPRDRAKAEKIAWAMQAICDNSYIGYGQSDRLSAINAAKAYGYDPSKISTLCNIDCSAAVRLCCLYAGIAVGDFYTGNEEDVLLATGVFDALKDDKYCKSEDYLLRGDILVTKSKGHTVVVLSNGSKTSGRWVKLGGKWLYYKADGSQAKNEWLDIPHSQGGSYWYWFDADGLMATGMQLINGEYYYLEENWVSGGVYEGTCYHNDKPSGSLSRWNTQA